MVICQQQSVPLLCLTENRNKLPSVTEEKGYMPYKPATRTGYVPPNPASWYQQAVVGGVGRTDKISGIWRLWYEHIQKHGKIWKATN